MRFSQSRNNTRTATIRKSQGSFKQGSTDLRTWRHHSPLCMHTGSQTYIFSKFGKGSSYWCGPHYNMQRFMVLGQVVTFVCALGHAPYVARQTLQMHGFPMQTWKIWKWHNSIRPLSSFYVHVIHNKHILYLVCNYLLCKLIFSTYYPIRWNLNYRALLASLYSPDNFFCFVCGSLEKERT